MSTAEFDQIADVYDDTRRALDEETLAGIREMLSKHACWTILEIGVGTGRIAVPLIKSGYDVSGLDVSRRMMEKANAKGVANLILADGTRTPFRDNSFDATLMAHVFHVLKDPLSVMREAARVSSVGVFALLRKRTNNRPWSSFFWGRNAPVAGNGDANEAAGTFFEERRERFRKLAEKYHWNWDPSRRFRNWGKELEILQTHPPDELKEVSDVVIHEALENRIARFEKGGYGFVREMPVEMREEIIKEMRASVLAHPEWARQPWHEVYQVALWRSEGLLSTP